MSYLPEVIEATYTNNFSIRLRFNDQSVKTVDFAGWLNGPVFEPLKKTSYFKRFFLDGGTVCWPNGADIAPETLYAAPSVTSSNSAITLRRTAHPTEMGA